nr:hypothetical protein [Tanacetum cinerariifolium]
MVNVIPLDHIDDVPVVEPNQHDYVPELVLVDEDEDPEEEKYKEEEDPQEEEEDDMEVNIEENDNETNLTYPYEEVDPVNPSPSASDQSLRIDGLFPSLMRRDINSLFGWMASLSRRLCGCEPTHALVKKKRNKKDKYYGKLILDLGNEVHSSVEERMTAMENLNERVKRDLYWTRVRAHEFYREMIRRAFMFKERPNEAIDFRGFGQVRGQDAAPIFCECTFVGFMKCNPSVFHDTKGVVELQRWFEKTKRVFEINECAEGKKVKFAVATLQGHALTWWNDKVINMGLETVKQMPWTEMK